MTRRVTILRTVVVSVIAIISAVFLTESGRHKFSSIAAPYPDRWLQVKPGMRSADVRKLIGEPTNDGRDLKTIDQWLLKQHGVELHLEVWFENQNNAEAVIIGVSRWKHFPTGDCDRHIDIVPRK